MDGSRTEELGNGRLVKDLALDRRRLDCGAHVVGETVEPLGQERLDRRRYFQHTTPTRSSSSRSASISSTKSGFPPAPSTICVSGWLVELDGTAEVVDQLRALGVGQRLEEDRGRIQPPATPLRPDLVELGPCDADEEQRCLVRPLGEVVDEVEKRRLAPVDVVEDEDERTTACQSLEERAHRPEAFVRAAHVVGQADHLPEPLGDRVRLLYLVEQSGELGQARRCRVSIVEVRDVADRLEHRPIGDPLAVRQTAAARDDGFRRNVVDELPNEARFPHARGTENREELTGTIRYRLLERVVHSSPLPLAADHRRVEAAHEARGVRSDEQRVSSTRPFPPHRRDSERAGASARP